jgi:hypothetical protein
MIDYRSELNPKPPIVATAVGGEILYPLNATLIRRVKTAAYLPWIMVGISAFNVFLSFYRAPIRLVLGLSITEFIFEIGRAIGPIATYIAMVVILGALCVFSGFGYYALRFRIWAFWAVIAVVSVDTVLFAATANIFSAFGLLYRIGIIVSMFSAIKPAKLYVERRQNGQA